MNNLDDPICQANHTVSSPAELVVYFDGGCPLCDREIAFYRTLDQAGKIHWEDVSTEAASCPVGLDRETLLKRFHVRDVVTGEMHSGARGFAKLWCSLPGIWPYLGKVARIPGVAGVMEWGYILTLKIRPWLARRISH